MSDPNEPRAPGDPDAGGPPPAPPSSSPAPSPDAQPTQAYPGVPAENPDAQPTQSYPGAPAQDPDAQPTQAYGGYSGAQQQYPGQPGPEGAAAAAYPAAPPQYGGPRTADARPRTLAIVALAAAVLGVLLCLGGFIPAAGIATVLVVIGGILLLAAFVLSLIVLFSRTQGGKPLGIVALVVSVLGGILFAVAFFASLVWIGLAAAGREDAVIDPGPTSTVQPSEEASEEASEEPSEEPTATAAPPAPGTYDEAAYLAAVRPEIRQLLQEIQPGITEEQVDSVYSDEVLITIGQSFIALGSVEGGIEAGREQFVQSMIDSSDGAINEEQANRFFDTVGTAAELYLVQ